MAEETYDQQPWSNTYDDEDVNLVEVPSMVFVNEVADGKQNATILQPSDPVNLQPNEPPLNPVNGDMWIDDSVFPRIIYTWKDTQWVKAGATTAEEVGSYTIGQVDDSLGQISMDLQAVRERTTLSEEALSDGEGLASKITTTATYTLDRDNAIDGKITDLVSNLGDENYVNTNLPKMVTESILQRKADEITANFSSIGGVNILKNSVGYADLLNWTLKSGSVSKYDGADAEAGSGFTMTTGVIEQAVFAIAGQPYTITAKVKKGTIGTGYMKLSDGSSFQQVDLIATAAYDYTTIQITGFVPANNILLVEIGGSGVTGGIIFTSLMLNTGTQGLQWSNANGEVYNTVVTFDINGVKVKSNVYDGYTIMSPQEFSGYYRNTQGVMQRVFTLNKDVTEVAKLKVTDAESELEMGTLKMIGINDGGYSGWAIVPV